MVRSLLNMLLSDHDVERSSQMGEAAAGYASSQDAMAALSQKDNMRVMQTGSRAVGSLRVGRRLTDTIVTTFHGALLQGQESMALQLFKLAVLGLYKQASNVHSAAARRCNVLNGHHGIPEGEGGVSCDQAGMLLVAAVRGRCRKVLELLLLPLPEGAGLDVAACDHRAVRAAAALGDVDLVGYMVDVWGADVAARGEEALHAAIRRGDKFMASFLMSKRSSTP
jgi:hypothetical protein